MNYDTPERRERAMNAWLDRQIAKQNRVRARTPIARLNRVVKDPRDRTPVSLAYDAHRRGLITTKQARALGARAVTRNERNTK